ncbi:MAG: NAD(P)-binding protein, partial [Candidatus Eremiobacteraeota bacterium]|nr:NAD(P)-binding protein [Candidatus Eremiobacteraeota bacterium]
MYDFLIVGAGLAGCTIAERLASQSGAHVLVVDERDHIAGNTYDPIAESGNRIHKYGPHIFHTNSSHVVTYLSAFTAWRSYEHRVLARVRGRLVPIPINRTTLNSLYGLALDEPGAARFLAERAERRERILNSEDAIVSKVGRELYELFFRGYTRKQWALDPTELDATVCGRIPTRTNDDDRYFTDAFQAMPADGFATMCARMLDHPAIDVATGTRFEAAADAFRFNHLIYTGPIDQYYDRRFGPLPYRSLRFEFTTVSREDGLPVGCVNEPSEEVPYTRTTDFGHLCGNASATTVLCREFPQSTGDPYYPIPRPENRTLYDRYKKLAEREANVTFVGRLAEY